MTKILPSDPRLAGLRLSARERLARALTKAMRKGTLNRADIQEIGEVSVTQASNDIQEILSRFPRLLFYDTSAKTYIVKLRRKA